MAKRPDTKNIKLNAARTGKNDEFYTQLPDIETELRHYREHFRNKTIFCNCDDPYESNFFKYFALNFNALGLKKLIATCYAGSPIANTLLSLFDDESPEEKTTRNPHKIEISEVTENPEMGFGMAEVAELLKHKKNVLTRLKGDGDFRSAECIELLKQADIVVTNPPFSLFREYVSQLDEYKKKFLIIGNKNAITYKEVFKLIKDNHFFTGNRPMAGGMWLCVPEGCDFDKTIGGKKLKNVPSCWFTNMKIAKHNEEIKLYKTYTAEEYPKYDNYDAIEVAKVVDIPVDYDGIMGVPITFLDKYNPKQFEIVGLIAGNIKGLAGIPSKIGKDGPYINGKLKYGRLLIRNK